MPHYEAKKLEPAEWVAIPLPITITYFADVVRRLVMIRLAFQAPSRLFLSQASRGLTSSALILKPRLDGRLTQRGVMLRRHLHPQLYQTTIEPSKIARRGLL